MIRCPACVSPPGRLPFTAVLHAAPDMGLGATALHFWVLSTCGAGLSVDLMHVFSLSVN